MHFLQAHLRVYKTVSIQSPHTPKVHGAISSKAMTSLKTNSVRLTT